MQHDAWFFVGFFFLVFLVWMTLGGPTRPLSFSGPTLSLPGALGGGTYLSLPRANVGVGGRSTAGGSSRREEEIPSSATLEGVGFGAPSPHRGKITVGHFVSKAGERATEEYIQLSLSSNAPGPVTISGWTVLSEATHVAAVIPHGTEVPRSGVVNPQGPISLSPGDRALIITGRSPIGVSFRENKCSGYLSSFQVFAPAFPNTCPPPATELKNFYGPDYLKDTECIEYVDTLPRCKVVTRPPKEISDACENFVTDHLHYNGCLTLHQHEKDFKGKTWRVYLGRSASMWREEHEVVKILDHEGKTVDAFAY